MQRQCLQAGMDQKRMGVASLLSQRVRTDRPEPMQCTSVGPTKGMMFGTYSSLTGKPVEISVCICQILRLYNINSSPLLTWLIFLLKIAAKLNLVRICHWESLDFLCLSLAYPKFYINQSPVFLLSLESLSVFFSYLLNIFVVNFSFISLFFYFFQSGNKLSILIQTSAAKPVGWEGQEADGNAANTRYSTKNLLIHFDTSNESLTFVKSNANMLFKLRRSSKGTSMFTQHHSAGLPVLRTYNNTSVSLNQTLGYSNGSINCFGLLQSTLHPRLYFHLLSLLCFDPLLCLSFIFELVHSFAYISSCTFSFFSLFPQLINILYVFEPSPLKLESVIFDTDLSYLSLIFKHFLVRFVQPNPFLVCWTFNIENKMKKIGSVHQRKCVE
ncbi:hypothetical protein VP01_1211g3 [Puccinia sorghi]|uniref:Uncharacterized protein n=1 Tax=Puccinia sorghi TaxID=27349 RepID=A0A0L6VQA8_9BASI|nr:hypothetical protein VP01_1211g3 [Puccinia sorghi]